MQKWQSAIQWMVKTVICSIHHVFFGEKLPCELDDSSSVQLESSPLWFLQRRSPMIKFVWLPITTPYQNFWPEKLPPWRLVSWKRSMDQKRRRNDCQKHVKENCLAIFCDLFGMVSSRDRFKWPPAIGDHEVSRCYSLPFKQKWFH